MIFFISLSYDREKLVFKQQPCFYNSLCLCLFAVNVVFLSYFLVLHKICGYFTENNIKEIQFVLHFRLTLFAIFTSAYSLPSLLALCLSVCLFVPFFECLFYCLYVFS